MRSAKQQDWFPYDSKRVCYILADSKGHISQIDHTKTALQSAYDTVTGGQAVLYAVWPGEYRSDLFIIDDLNAFADAVGIDREDDHIHDLEWKLSDYDDGVSRYAYVECKFKCGCVFEKMGLKKFANDMRKQKDWVVATTKGCSYGGGSFTVSVSRASLKNR